MGCAWQEPSILKGWQTVYISWHWGFNGIHSEDPQNPMVRLQNLWNTAPLLTQWNGQDLHRTGVWQVGFNPAHINGFTKTDGIYSNTISMQKFPHVASLVNKYIFYRYFSHLPLMMTNVLFTFLITIFFSIQQRERGRGRGKNPILNYTRVLRFQSHMLHLILNVSSGIS